jgi:hypothetical protein
MKVLKIIIVCLVLATQSSCTLYQMVGDMKNEYNKNVVWHEKHNNE